MPLFTRRASPAPIARYAPPPAGAPSIEVPTPATDLPPAAVDRDELPRGTTPTYELEMLISGSVTFGLLQLPPVFNAAFDAATARVGAEWEVPVAIAWILAKAMLYVLTGSFLLHLVVRAYWVGLVGLDSVFPGGIRWDRLAGRGPIAREEHARRLPSLKRTIARLDNVASTIFSIAFLEVLFVFGIAVPFAVLVALAWIADLVPDRTSGVWVVRLGLPAFLLVTVGGWALDIVVGRRLRRGGLLYRVLRARARLTYRLFGVVVYGPLVYTLLTNVRKRFAIPLLAVGALASLQLAILDGNRHTNGPIPELGAYLPGQRARQEVANGDYESLRPAVGAPRLAPTIQSDVVEGPYVKLFVPYVRERDEVAMRRECPGVVPLMDWAGGAGASAGALAADSAAYVRAFACLARVRSVTLDGRPVADLTYRYYQHPVSGTPGLVAYLPTDALAKGMHTLYVRSSDDTTSAVRRGSTIVFWR
jgi:hypothetical protein